MESYVQQELFRKEPQASRRQEELPSSASVNRDQRTCKKPRKINASEVFSCPKIFDGLSPVLTDSDGNFVVNEGLTGGFRPHFRPLLVNRWANWRRVKSRFSVV